jgi:hypothetical protein
MAVYYAVGACAAILQLAITASAALLLFGGGKGSDSLENPILIAAIAIVGASSSYEVTDVNLREDKIEIRNLDSGNRATFSAADIKNGVFRFKNSGGDEINIGVHSDEKNAPGKPADMPEGMVIYPGATPRAISYTASDEFYDGAIEQTTSDPIPKVLATFERALMAAGYTISSKILYEDSGSIVSEHEDPYRVIAVDATLEESRTKIVIQYLFRANK